MYMCGRYVLAEDPAVLVSEFGAEFATEAFNHVAGRSNFNVAPTTMVPVVRVEHGADSVDHRVLDLIRWGIAPKWAGGKSTILVNARGESVAEKSTFRKAFATSRCLIPATGYYEWKRPEKDPYFIFRAGKTPMAMAGLIVGSELDGEVQPTCAIITLPAAANIHSIHDRMPATIDQEDWQEWLDPDVGSDEALMLMNADPHLIAHQVSRRVNSIRYNDASLIEPLAPEAEHASPQQDRLL